MTVSIENGLLFKLNQIDSTACVVHSERAKDDILIPQEIIYDSQKYSVVSIKNRSFYDCQIRSVTFPADSFVYSFGGSIFNESKIQSLFLPASLAKVNNEWCNGVKYLRNITISPQNKNFTYLDDDHKLIGGKSNNNSDVFDVLLFACRDIINAVIPFYIKKINAYSFQYCQKIQSVTFSKDSQLISVGDYSFYHSSIQSIVFPKKLRYLGKECFVLCHHLQKVSFEEPSIIEGINGNTFEYSSIKYLYIPSSIKRLDDNWCVGTKQLNGITISPKNENFMLLDQKLILYKSRDSYDTISFCARKAHAVTIPSFITSISSNAFENCSHLSKIIFTEDSQLENIGDCSFVKTKIETISFPSTISKIGSQVFDNCFRLSRINFPFDSKINKFQSKIFSETLIRELVIPNSVKKMKSGWCSSTKALEQIHVSPENKNFAVIDDCLYGRSEFAFQHDNFDVLLFANRKIKDVVIPDDIKFIDSYAFEYCSSLSNVEISHNSNLLVIGFCAFSSTIIRSIFIPKEIKEIQISAFYGCKFLETVDIDEDSRIDYLDIGCFENSPIKRITIPSHTSKLTTYFYGKLCKLNEIVISPKNKELGYLDSAHKLIGCKSNKYQENFDVLCFACCDIKEAIIPAYVRTISSNAFSHCSHLKSIVFDDESQLMEINNSAFDNSSIESISIPKNVSKINFASFSNCSKIQNMEFLNDDVFFSSFWFQNNYNPLIVSFPNASRVFFEQNITSFFSQNTKIFANIGCKFE